MEVVRNKVLFAGILTLFFTACQNDNLGSKVTGFQNTSAQCYSNIVPNQFVVRWKDGTTTVEHAESKEAFMTDVMEPNADAIQFAENDMLIKVPSEPKTETPQTFTAQEIVPNDWGQTRIEAPAVWAQGYKGQGVIVAVVDSGVDVNHIQLRNQIAINTGEIPGNGIDDDHNGLVDDVTGYDFNSNTGVMRDGSGHGTHVAGVILADQTAGDIKGIAPEAKVLPVRFMDDKGAGMVSAAIAGINYAVSRGAKVINASWGAGLCSVALRQTIAELASEGVLFNAAAGNGDEFGNGMNIDSYPEFPAAFGLPGQLTIGASTYHEARASFSNYSYNLVQLMAPGQDIYSTYPNNQMKKMSGTSMATPFVSGVAAVLFGVRPNATVAEVRSAIMNGVDQFVGVYPVTTGGRLNLRRAVLEIQKLSP